MIENRKYLEPDVCADCVDCDDCAACDDCSHCAFCVPDCSHCDVSTIAPIEPLTDKVLAYIIFKLATESPLDAPEREYIRSLAQVMANDDFYLAALDRSPRLHKFLSLKLEYYLAEVVK